jgi:hypothetical protein
MVGRSEESELLLHSLSIPGYRTTSLGVIACRVDFRKPPVGARAGERKVVQAAQIEKSVAATTRKFHQKRQKKGEDDLGMALSL